MARADTTALEVAQREPSGSRGARRLRREGNVPGVVYGGDEGTVPFQVDARTLRLALAHAGAVLQLKIADAESTPVVVKDLVRHPVSGETVHLDLLRVRLDQLIQATVVLELVGADDSPGVKDGGVLEHVTRELTLEALSPPATVKLIDDPETVIAILSAPRLQTEEEPGIEEETEIVGEGETGEAAEAESSDDGGSGGDDGGSE